MAKNGRLLFIDTDIYMHYEMYDSSITVFFIMSCDIRDQIDMTEPETQPSHKVN